MRLVTLLRTVLSSPLSTHQPPCHQGTEAAAGRLITLAVVDRKDGSTISPGLSTFPHRRDRGLPPPGAPASGRAARTARGHHPPAARRPTYTGQPRRIQSSL